MPLPESKKEKQTVIFTLVDQNKKTIQSEELKGKKILLSFHPLAWTGICAKQMQSLEQSFEQFQSANVIPFGVSIDTVPSKSAWADSLNIKSLSLLSDFWPHGQLAKQLGLFLEEKGFSKRANILLDENHKIIFKKVYEISELPDIEEILQFLQNNEGEK